MKQVLLLTCLLSGFFLTTTAQVGDLTLKIKSGQKQLFSEAGMLKELIDDEYHAKTEGLKRAVTEWLRAEVKKVSKGQTMHSDQVNLSVRSRIELGQEGNRIFLQYILSGNELDFRVTTPEVLGVGFGKYKDPEVSITFDVIGHFELKQSGTAESIWFTNPSWSIRKTGQKASNLNRAYFDNDQVTFIAFGLDKLQPVYASLNSMNEKVNTHLQAAVKKHPELLKEFATDENQQLQAVADIPNNTLVFVHRHSSKGIAKRSATTDAQTITAGPKATIPTPVPVSTSATGFGKRNGETKPPPKLNPPPVRKN